MVAPAEKRLQKIELSLPGVFLIVPPLWSDARGAFAETFRADKYAELGVRDNFVQDNQSTSLRGVLRGLHLQATKPQSKLCRVVYGEVFDVAVDVRRGSATFGQWTGARLSAENRHQIYIPAGFAHGFVVLSERAEFLYKCDAFYDVADEVGIIWNDPKLAIDWGVARPVLSDKDSALPRLADIPPERLPQYHAEVSA